jgi:hypothetical protein
MTKLARQDAQKAECCGRLEAERVASRVGVGDLDDRQVNGAEPFGASDRGDACWRLIVRRFVVDGEPVVNVQWRRIVRIRVSVYGRRRATIGPPAALAESG